MTGNGSNGGSDGGGSNGGWTRDQKIQVTLAIIAVVGIAVAATVAIIVGLLQLLGVIALPELRKTLGLDKSPSPSPTISSSPGTVVSPTALPSASSSPNATPQPDLARLVGTWQYRGDESLPGAMPNSKAPVEIRLQIKNDKTYQSEVQSLVQPIGAKTSRTGSWSYSNGVLELNSSNGKSSRTSIQWIDDNHFTSTIFDITTGGYSGLKRDYYRVSG